MAALKRRRTYLAHVDAGGLLALGVLVSQVGDDGDGAEAGVLGQRVGDDLERLGKGSVAVGLLAADLLGVLGQLQGNFNLGRTTSGNQIPVGQQLRQSAREQKHKGTIRLYLVLTSDLMTQRAS